MDDLQNCSELLINDKDNTTEELEILVVMAVVSFLSLFMNILTVSVALYLKVYKHFAHRLAMYLVCSSILTNIINISQLALLLDLDDEKLYILCNLIGPLRQYFMSVELLFAVCFTFHLFCLAVLQRSFKYSEDIYVLVAIVIPFVVVCLTYLEPDTYGIDVAWCGISNNTLHLIIWYGPVSILQFMNAIEVIAIPIAICYRLSSLKREREVLINRVNANEKALKELLPLVVYILIFVLLTSIPFVYRLIVVIKNDNTCIVYFAMVHVICDGLWGCNCSFAQLNHLYINRKLTRKQNKKLQTGRFTRLNGLHDTFSSHTELSTEVNTHFTVLEESDVDPFHMQ